ncbi:MAG TPA: S1 RNA-binding domain-containing protein [Anaeromyxobacter sp.]|nr:S1 RNA-binding domain-containing protein [Anaeromyxobacter sp.]
MSEEKKSGPVVIRKGHVKPPPPGAKIEATEVEVLPPAPERREQPDPRPLWQRLAEEKAGAPRPASADAPRAAPQPVGPRRGPHRGDRPRGERRDRPDRRPQRGERPRTDDRAAAERGPRPPAGEPPPAPDPVVADEGSFADLLASSEAAPRPRHKVGDKAAGKVIQLGHDVAFLELGSGHAEAMIDVAELKDAEGNVTVREGDIVDGVVVQASERGVVISKGHGRTTRDHAREAVIEAARTGLPVEGVVKAVNKGGLEVEVHGVRAFCPVSQIDVRFVGDPASFVGQRLQFRVQRADQRDVVLSRRALLEAERAEKARATREKLVPGAVLEGVVTAVQEYGAFVDLGGVEGLVHVSELSWDRVSKPADLLKPGDAVQVQVLKIEQDPKKGERIGLSVRALTPKPEPKAAPEAPPRPAPPPPPKPGDVVEASVDKVESFGVFVRFAGGRGLVPASETGTPRGSDLRRAFKVGDTFPALVLAVDEQHRIRLSKAGAEEAAERREAAEYLKAAAPRASGKGFGTLGDLLRQKLEKK